MPFCSNCGKEIPQGAEFCPECGSRQPGAAPQNAQYVPSQPIAQQPIVQQPAAPQVQYNPYYGQEPPAPKSVGLMRTCLLRALNVVLKKPIRLWALSLLNTVMQWLSSVLCGIIPALALAVNYNLQLGMSGIFLKGYQSEGEEKVETEELFEGFKKNGKTFLRNACSMGWKDLLVFLWCLIPVVGWIFGIIRAYGYRFVPYLLKENPELGAIEAARKSKEMTQGHKSKMFWAEVLIFVAIEVVTVCLTTLGRIPYVGVIFYIVAALFCLIVAVLSPLYLGLVRAAFYEEVKNS